MPNWYMVFNQSSIELLKQRKEGIFDIPTNEKPNLIFTDEKMAMKQAEKMASEKPGFLIMIYEGSFAVEAGKAPIIRKQINKDGELVPLKVEER